MFGQRAVKSIDILFQGFMNAIRFLMDKGAMCLVLVLLAILWVMGEELEDLGCDDYE
ncbi:MAG: hypothetical protein PHS46_08085 [Candidatus Omnitrophica bacterium]|nr:hypothetical protein [Candidatus Omnitrophota bacterium]